MLKEFLTKLIAGESLSEREAAEAMRRIVSGDAPPRFLNPEGKPLAFIRASYSHF